MIRKAKLLGLAVVAVLALSAVAASSAFALELTTEPNETVTLTGTQEGSGHVFSVGGSNVTCTTANFSGTLVGHSTTQTMEAEYGNCTAFGFVGATITGMRSGEKRCDYLFHVTGVDGSGNPVASADLNCSSGIVTIDAGPCTVTIEPSKNQGRVTNTITNKKETIEGMEVGTITIDHDVTNIHAVVDSGFGCPVAGGTYTNASYTGSTTVRARNSTTGTPVTIHVK